MSIPPPLPEDDPKKERPDAVWAIFVFYWVGFVFTLGTYALASLPLLQGKPFSLDPIDMAGGIIALIVRGIATVKLFFLKPDAWIFFAASLAITLTILIMNCIGAAIMNQPLYMNLYITVVTAAIWIYITFYAYKICNRKEIEQDAAANP